MTLPRVTRADGRRLTAEAIGTFFLVLIGPGAAMVNAWSGGLLGASGIALAFAFVVIAMVYALGHVSGAHINPAVTIAFWSARRFPARDVIPYVVAQCAGATAAAATLSAILGPVGHLGATLPAISIGGTFATEWLLSFVLMLVIMAVATDDRVPPGFAPLAVGLTVGFCALTGGPLTGASMNPARSFGPAVIGGLWTAHWVYWLAPITGMAAAARVYDWLRDARAPTAGRPFGLQGSVLRWTACSHFTALCSISMARYYTVGASLTLLFASGDQNVRQAWEIGLNDPDAVCVHQDDSPLVRDGRDNAV